MPLIEGSVTVADDGSRTGSGYALYLYDLREALVPNPYPGRSAPLSEEQRTQLLNLLPTYEAASPPAIGAPFPLEAVRPAEIEAGDWARLLAAGLVTTPPSAAVARLEALRGVAVGAARSAAEIIPYLLANL